MPCHAMPFRYTFIHFLPHTAQTVNIILLLIEVILCLFGSLFLIRCKTNRNEIKLSLQQQVNCQLKVEAFEYSLNR